MMIKTRKLIAVVVAIILLLGLITCSFTGCRVESEGPMNPTNFPTSAPTTGSTTEPTTEPSGTGEAGGTGNTTAPTTAPTTEPTTEATEAPTTEPSTAPTTEPTTAPTEEPTAGTTEGPTVPPTSEPTEPPTTEPPTTEPPTTEPPTTEPPTTEPPTTEPPTTEPPHTHEYRSTVFAPTCTEDGYTTYTCECGDTYDDDYVEATGHDYETKVVDPTTTSEGYTVYTCIECGYTFKDDYTEKLPEPTDPPCEHEYNRTSVDGTCLEEGHFLYQCIYCGDSYKEPNGFGWGEHYYDITETVEPTPEKDGYCMMVCRYCGDEIRNPIPYEMEPVYQTPDAQEVAQAVVKYINQLRAEEGVGALEMLPGMTQVAEYRSVQLSTNFEHDTEDIREAHAYYEYGKWFNPAEYGNPDGEGYYSSNSREAIGRSKPGQVSVDEIGKYIAKEFNASASHWAYVGSSDYSYIGVGCYYWGGEWFTCIMVNREGIYG